jgi:hypothetical protein
VSLETILLGIGGIVAAAGGIYITVHELRRRERKVTRAEIHELSDEVQALTNLLLEQRRYIYTLVALMIDAGMDPPPPPAPSFDPDEYDKEE